MLAFGVETDRCFAADKNMNADNAASYCADAATKRPRAAHAEPSENPGAYDQAVLTFLATH
jgi:hypothetical protein